MRVRVNVLILVQNDIIQLLFIFIFLCNKNSVVLVELIFCIIQLYILIILIFLII
jgi:hypothetical protein